MAGSSSELQTLRCKIQIITVVEIHRPGNRLHEVRPLRLGKNGVFLGTSALPCRVYSVSGQMSEFPDDALPPYFEC